VISKLKRAGEQKNPNKEEKLAQEAVKENQLAKIINH
jgi:hypothetical protein